MRREPVQCVIVKSDVQKKRSVMYCWVEYSHQNSPYYYGRSKEQSGVKWRECENPYIHTAKSDSLSPPDKGPLDKCGQQERSPASAVMGCRTVIRMKLYWAKWGSEARGPRLRNSANSDVHSSSCWLNLLKNLHIGIHHTQKI